MVLGRAVPSTVASMLVPPEAGKNALELLAATLPTKKRNRGSMVARTGATGDGIRIGTEPALDLQERRQRDGSN